MKGVSVRRVLGGGVLLAILGAGAALFYLQGQGIAPRTLAPYVDKRSSGHNILITGAGQWLGASLLDLDRGETIPALAPPLSVGAQAATAPRSDGTRKLAGTGEELRRAVAAAAPGDIIVLLPGSYRIHGDVLASRAGDSTAPIVVRADQPGTVTIEFDAGEGFKVSAPYWRFENLSIRGACARQEFCEHAFHVAGGAHHFAAVNNTILNFNAHFKINGDGGLFPDAGLIEGNTLGNTAPRRTSRPVTPIDIVAASDWIIRRNLITDFIKEGGDQVSYGAFAKGAGTRTLFEQNVVLCEQRLRGLPGQRVGLSFGGGGTGKPYCRDRQCITEQDGGTMRANLIASCSDAGIYVNASAGSRLLDNTLVDTAGIDARFPESSVTLEGNLVDGDIRGRNGAQLHAGDNLQTPTALLYLGYHPLRKLFATPAVFDFSWRETPREYMAPAAPSKDLCGVVRQGRRRYGAFEDYKACLARPR
ncbi:hypothetical protein SRABI118_02155 [Massilia sp. Bi118]|uniref:chondroitinase-B domain-containing protein n=1 Tax=Massilia sp. Bi118 TaxID=2822346 RepID=UPI001DD56F22|nr:chondroitinase-B domain-containing protein [Massilia sp. Bi118]CAH0218157.1 hypothetical protein SRABI118_02155 [Massilia sp. Bi118]